MFIYHVPEGFGIFKITRSIDLSPFLSRGASIFTFLMLVRRVILLSVLMFNYTDKTFCFLQSVLSFIILLYYSQF